jgi:hypothetical protein
MNGDAEVVAYWSLKELIAVFIFKNKKGEYNAYEVMTKCFTGNRGMSSAIQLEPVNALKMIQRQKGMVNIKEEQLNIRGEELFRAMAEHMRISLTKDVGYDAKMKQNRIDHLSGTKWNHNSSIIMISRKEKKLLFWTEKKMGFKRMSKEQMVGIYQGHKLYQELLRNGVTEDDVLDENQKKYKVVSDICKGYENEYEYVETYLAYVITKEIPEDLKQKLDAMQVGMKL